MTSMYVIKRNGRQEPVMFDKITARIVKLAYGLNPDFCDAVSHVYLELSVFPPGHETVFRRRSLWPRRSLEASTRA